MPKNVYFWAIWVDPQVLVAQDDPSVPNHPLSGQFYDGVMHYTSGNSMNPRWNVFRKNEYIFVLILLFSGKTNVQAIGILVSGEQRRFHITNSDS